MIVYVFAAAFVTSLLLTPLARRIGRRFGLLDRPNERSSHTVATPRNGGYAIVAGIAAGVAIVAGRVDAELGWILAGGLLFAAVGAADDRFGLREITKLLIQLAIVGALVFAGGLIVGFVDLGGVRLGSTWFLAPLTLLWLAGYVNAFNFMDGINGIAATHAIVAGWVLMLLLGGAGDFAGAMVALAITGAAAGYLPWNLPSGSIFMGDVGSTSLGFLLAALAVRYSMQPEGDFLPAILPMLPFVLDTSITLVRRIARKERWFSAHRSHFYQRLNQTGWTHGQVTLLWTAMAIASAIPSIFWITMTAGARLAAISGIVVAHLAVFGWISARESRSERESGDRG